MTTTSIGQSTANSVINIGDKKLENLNGSFNLTVTAVPIQQQISETHNNTNHIVKEELHEED